MAVPRSRLSTSRRNKRRGHHKKPTVNLAQCPNCKSPCVPHAVCISCGMYRGRSYKTEQSEV